MQTQDTHTRLGTLVRPLPKSKEGSTGNGIDRSKASNVSSNVSCTVDGKVLLYRDHDAANRDHGT